MSEMQPNPLPDLLESQQVYRHKRRRRRSSRYRFFKRLKKQLTRYDWRISLLMIGGVIAAVVMSGLILSLNARDRVDNSWNSLDRIWSSIGEKSGADLTLSDFDRLHNAVTDLEGSLSSAKKQTAFLRPFTFANANLDTGLHALDAAQQLSMAADNMLTGMQPTMFFLTEGQGQETVTTQISSGERVVELIGLGRGQFLSAQTHLEQADNIIASLKLDKVSPQMLVTINGLTKYRQKLSDINSMLLDSANLLTAAFGLDGTKSYLILSANNDELRPSGGYISTYGWMTVRNGRIEDYSYNPTTATSPNPPSTSLASNVDVPGWWIQYQEPITAAWDGSWYVDFPSTAKMAAWYYDNGGNPESPVDGVIGIDITGFEYILQGLGSVTVPDYNEVVTPENFREMVYKYRAEKSGGDLLHKRFLVALYNQILTDWQTASQDTDVKIRGALLRALDEKHIMIYFTDAQLNQAINVLNWSGIQKSGANNDYLLAAEANLGNKANHSVIRQFTYDVEIMPDGSLHSRTSIDYDYSARVAEKDPAVRPENGSLNYRSLLQVFAPANSTLTGTDKLSFAPTVVPTPTYTAFVTQIGIDYNQSDRFQFSYTTPPLVEKIGRYRVYKLVMQQQPGTPGESVNVQITLPKGTTIVHTSPAAAASYSLDQPILEFRVALLGDQTIEVIYTQ